MKNSFLLKFKSSIILKIQGKNVRRFLNKLIHQNIELLNVREVSRNELEIRVYKEDVEKIYKIRTIYEIDEVDSCGFIKIKQVINKNKILIFFIVIGMVIIFFLSNVIFEVEVVHNKKEIRELLLSELKNYDIAKNNLVKSFSEVEKIKEEILEKYKDKLEWIEIERVGTKYIVRVEEREIPNSKQNLENRNIVAKKSAIIKDIIAEGGVVEKKINDYVKAGDIVISGNIYLNEALKGTLAAKGKIYGEVWYKSKVEVPFVYNESNYTANINKVLTVKFLNYRFELFNFHKYMNKEIEERKIIYHSFLPLELVYEKQREVEKIDKIYTIDEAINIARDKSIKAMESKLNDNEYIISSKDLKVEIKESKIVLDMFFSVYEDITDYQAIEENELEQE